MVDLALPQLKLMTFEERRVFMKTVRDLVAADGRMSLFEFTLLAILRRHLPGSTKRKKQVTRFSYHAVEREIALLLSLMIRVGGDTEGADQRYARLVRSFTLPRLIDIHCPE